MYSFLQSIGIVNDHLADCEYRCRRWNLLYEQMFNPQYVNKEYLMQNQYQQFKAEQQKEIKKAVKVEILYMVNS